MAYWVVSVTKYELRQKGIKARWSENLRILTTQVRASAEMELEHDKHARVRMDITPEEKLLKVYSALNITANPKGILVTI